MPFFATPIKISSSVENILCGFARSRTLPLSQIQRAKIIIAANAGRNNQEIAVEVGLIPDTVSKWRMRWAKHVQLIEEVEQKKPEDLAEFVKSILKDSPRPGCPCNFTEIQVLQILEIACRNPTEFGYETSHWSTPQLAKVVTKLRIVDSISPASVNRFLKYGGYSTSQSKILDAFDR